MALNRPPEQSTSAYPSMHAHVRAATTGLPGEVVVRSGDDVWIALLEPLQPVLGDSDWDRCTRRLRALLDEVASAELDVNAAAEALSCGMHEELVGLGGGGVSAASLLLLRVVGGRARLAWTARGAAYLVRSGEIVGVAEGQRAVEGEAGIRLPSSVSAPPLVSALGKGDRPRLHVLPFVWVLRSGDRIVLLPRALSTRFQRKELVSLLASGPAEGAAHTIQEALRLRREEDVPSAVVEVGAEGRCELEVADGELQSLFDDLSEVLLGLEAEAPVAEGADSERDKGLPQQALEPPPESFLEVDTLAGRSDTPVSEERWAERCGDAGLGISEALPVRMVSAPQKASEAQVEPTEVRSSRMLGLVFGASLVLSSILSWVALALLGLGVGW